MTKLIWDLTSPDFIAGSLARVIGEPTTEIYDGSNTIAFNGSSDGLLLPVNPLQGSGRFSCTVECFPKAGGDHEQRFLHAGSVHGDRALLELRTSSDGGWYLDVYLAMNGWSCALRDPTKVHAMERWYSVAIAFDGRMLSGLVGDAVELCRESELPLNSGRMTGENCSIGMRQNRTSFFRGGIRRIIWHYSDQRR